MTAASSPHRMRPTPPEAADPASDPRLRRPAEVVRTRVLELLTHRWDRTVTTVVAGAGFGKSVAVAQAMRADRVAPHGVEGRISARWGCEDAVRLVASAAASLDAPLPPRGSPLARLQSAVGSLAPLPVCLVIDDVEVLPLSGTYLLDALLDALPTNLRLVLVGRSLPPFGLARLRAAGDLLELTDDDLRFDAAEIAGLADLLGVPAPDEHLGGWPAVIRLSLAAPGRAADDFLWEEVIRRLGAGDRPALAALCAVGTATVAELEELTGAALDPDGFRTRVPLVSGDGDRLVAHDLWRPFLPDLVDDADLAELTDRALALVEGRGDVVAAGQLAIRLGDQAALRRDAVRLVQATIGSLPVDVAADWLAAADDTTAASPQLGLLRCARANALDTAEPPDVELDAVLGALREEGATADEAVGIAIAALAADARGDLGRIAALALRARELTGVESDPILSLLVDAVDAVVATLQGEVGTALGLLDRPRPGLPPAALPEAVTRLHWHLLLLSGRADDAVAVAAAAASPATPMTGRPLEAVARWLAGDPDGFDPDHEELGPARYEGLTERDRFDHAAFVAMMAASAPKPDAVDLAVTVLAASPFASDVGPDAAFVTAAKAVQCVVRHDDDDAARELDRFLDRGALDELTELHLRRFLAVPYVLAPAMRAAWDEAELGPSQRRTRAIARLLLDARDGRCPDIGPEPLAAVATVLPLPWSLELACRAAAAGRAWGIELGVELADRFGAGVAAELAHAARREDTAVRDGAARVLQGTPTAPPFVLDVRVLGPMELVRDGEVVEVPELRRARVRELLSVLAVERSVTRDRAIELLWPDSDPVKGRANLRVTLAHLVNALEPNRPPRAPTYFLRATPTHLVLPAVGGLVVDLWDVEAALDAARRAADEGDARGRTDALRRAVDRWRGRPLPDLDAVVELADAASVIDRQLVDAAVALGELELVAGAVDRSLVHAERAVAADRYDERGHRLAIAARLQGADRRGAADAVTRLRAMLDDLGAGPEPATEVLLRQAAEPPSP